MEATRVSDIAVLKAREAASSEESALRSKNEAVTAAGNALNSANIAMAKAESAASSEDAAKRSELAAKASENRAIDEAITATTRASEASTSAQAARTSETNAVRDAEGSHQSAVDAAISASSAQRDANTATSARQFVSDAKNYITEMLDEAEATVRDVATDMLTEQVMTAVVNTATARAENAATNAESSTQQAKNFKNAAEASKNEAERQAGIARDAAQASEFASENAVTALSRYDNLLYEFGKEKEAHQEHVLDAALQFSSLLATTAKHAKHLFNLDEKVQTNKLQAIEQISAQNLFGMRRSKRLTDTIASVVEKLISDRIDTASIISEQNASFAKQIRRINATAKSLREGYEQGDAVLDDKILSSTLTFSDSIAMQNFVNAKQSLRTKASFEALTKSTKESIQTLSLFVYDVISNNNYTDTLQGKRISKVQDALCDIMLSNAALIAELNLVDAKHKRYILKKKYMITMQVDLLDPDDDGISNIDNGASFVSDDGVTYGTPSNVSLEVTP